MLVASVAAGAACASCSVCATAASGAKAMTAPRPIATSLFNIAVPLKASLPTLVSRTFSICAPHDELEMNTELAGRSDSLGLILFPLAGSPARAAGPQSRAQSATRSEGIAPIGIVRPAERAPRAEYALKQPLSIR